MNRFISLACVLVLLLCLAACGDEGDGSSSVVEPVGFTFTDDLGRSVTVDKPQRVAALMGSFAQTWLLAGGKLAAVTDDAISQWDLGLNMDLSIRNLGSYKSPDLELLLASEPDLVLLSSNTAQQMALLEPLEQAGVPMACFAVNDFDAYLNMLDICTQITGRRDLYDINGLAVQQQIRRVVESVPVGEAPRVLLLRASSSISVRAKNSSDTVAGVILKELGCVNIADSETGLLEDLSLESIILQDPDYIFVVTQGSDTQGALDNLEKTLTSNRAWSKLTAVKEGRCHILDKTLFHYKPNARWGESYEILAQILYGTKEG